MRLLEKKKSKRPFITDVIEAFPSNFRMKREADLKNFEKYKDQQELLEEKKVIDSGVHLIHNEFNALKGRLLEEKKKMNKKFNVARHLPQAKDEFDLILERPTVEEADEKEKHPLIYRSKTRLMNDDSRERAGMQSNAVSAQRDFFQEAVY